MSVDLRLDREYVRLRLEACAAENGDEGVPTEARLSSGGLARSFVAQVAEELAGVSPIPAAVLVGLLDEGEGPQVILTRRTSGLSNHPGEISFPGGRMEPQDAAPEQTALREAEEEVGLAPTKVEVLGCLPLYRTVSDYCVRPVVGWVQPPVTFRPDPREVAEVFLVPLSFIVDPANRRRGSLVRNGKRRAFYELRYEGRRIWGATAAILVSLTRVLEVG